MKLKYIEARGKNKRPLVPAPGLVIGAHPANWNTIPVERRGI
jgi:hypothetical protein